MTKVKLSLVLLLCVVLGSNVFGQNKPIGSVLQDFKNWSVNQGFSQADLQELKVTDDYVTKHNAVRHIYLQQSHKGIAIVNSNASIHVWKGKMIASHEKMVKGLGQKKLGSSPSLTPGEALQRLSISHGWNPPEEIDMLSIAKGIDQSGMLGSNQIAYEPIPFKLVYFADQKGGLKLGWNLQVQSTDGPHYYNSIIDANTGELIFEEDWVVECSFGANHVHNHSHDYGQMDADPHMNFFEESFMYAPRANSLEEANMMTGQYRVLAIPTESPNHGPYVLIQDPSDSTASPFGWHDTDGVPGPEYTITRGNNVRALEDRDGNDDSVPGYSPDGGPSLDFNFFYNSTLGPIPNEDIVITNLFYMNNIMHDVWYNYGFDEVSGNFQENIYGRGGMGDDAVRADAQDGSGFNNANFGTPPDGFNPTMQMFIFTSPPVDFTINSPQNIAGSYQVSRANFGGEIPTTSPITGNLVFVEDGTGNNEGCDSLTNAAQLDGNIALIDRGNCEFGSKALRAENAGATAVVVINNTTGLLTMAPGVDGAQVDIPVIMISQADGNRIRSEIGNGVIATVGDSTMPGFNPTDRDSDLDNGIIAHEYGHGISNRLTGGPGAAGCLNNLEQPGEGWSDWFALVMQVKPGDVGSLSKGVGTYAIGQPTSGGGIRTYPYSTDMNISPYTYDDIKTLSIPHGVGSVMCAMLWDLYWAMTDEHGYDADIYYGTGGNNMAMQLVMDGMKLQPCSPGFVDIRNAILLADSINYGGANQRLIWEVFSRRGLGASADQGSPTSRSDGEEAFDLPDIFKEVLITKNVNKNVVENGDTLTFTFFVRNQKASSMNNVTLRDTLASEFSYVNNSATVVFSLSGRELAFNLGTLVPGQDTSFSFQAIAVSNLAVGDPLLSDNFEGDVSSWRTNSIVGTGAWDTTNVRSFSPNISWFVPNLGEDNDQTLKTPAFRPTANTILSFWHNYDTEASWDGGVIEIFSGGQTIDLGSRMLQNPYNSGIGSNNPLGERLAFGGNSDGWIQTKIDLSDFAGEPSLVTFRFASDNNTFETGWFIDDVVIQEELLASNSVCLSSDEGDAFCAEIPALVTILSKDIASSTRELPNEVEIRLYPNPAQEQVSLEYFGTSTELLQVEFRNTIGQMVKSFEMRPFANQSSRKIDISSLPAGIYNISIRQGDMRTIKKLLVE